MTDPDPVLPPPTLATTDAPALASQASAIPASSSPVSSSPGSTSPESTSPESTSPAFTGPLSERARVEPAARKTDRLPFFYALGLLVLLVAGWYVYTNPPGGEGGSDLAAKLDGLNIRTAALEQRPVVDLGPMQKQMAALDTRIATIEQRPVLAALDQAALKTRLDAATGDLTTRLATLDRRVASAEQGLAQIDGKIDGKIGLLDAKLGQVGTTVDTAVAAKVAAAEAVTTARVNQIGTQLNAQVDAKVGALTDTARKLAFAQAGALALESGQKLGAIPGAPPALARFADVAPPTEYALKQSFGVAADAATRASVPQTEEKPFLSRLWTRAQQSVSVREGDRVLVGDPVTGILARARRALDGNDLAAALMALQGLSGAPRVAMADWIGQAQGVLDARAALAQMARG